MQLKTALRLNILVHVVHFVADAKRIDNASFKVRFLSVVELNDEFASVAGILMLLFVCESDTR